MPNTPSRGHGRKERSRKSAAASGGHGAASSPAANDPILGELVEAQHRTLATLYLSDTVGAVVASDDAKPGFGPALYLLPKAEGAGLVKIDALGRLRQAGEIPAGNNISFDRDALERAQHCTQTSKYPEDGLEVGGNEIMRVLNEYRALQAGEGPRELFESGNHEQYEQELDRRRDKAKRVMDNFRAQYQSAPALQLGRLRRDQRDLLLLSWPEDCDLTVIIAPDTSRPGEFADREPALYVTSSRSGAEPFTKLDGLGRVGGTEELPEGTVYTVDREVLKAFNQASLQPIKYDVPLRVS
jgi:hypothetical protein